MDDLWAGINGYTPLAQHDTPWAVERPHNGMRTCLPQALTAGLWDIPGIAHGRDGLAIRQGVRRQTDR